MDKTYFWSMKKPLFILTTLLASVTFAQAQFEKEDLLIHVGAGFEDNFTIGNATFQPGLGSIEYGITDQISVGPMFGFVTSRQTITQNPGLGITQFVRGKYDYTLYGLRGSYHLQKSDKVDVYFGLFLGAYQYEAKITTEQFVGNTRTNYAEAYPNVTDFGYSLHVGANYYIYKNFGLYAEFGYGLATVQAGLAARF